MGCVGSQCSGGWTGLSCTRFRDNEVRLQLHAVAYNLPNSRRLRDHKHRSERKTLVQLAESGDLDVRRQATWGMSVDRRLP
jgi:hypothetical protein